MAQKTLSKDALREQFEDFRQNVCLHSGGSDFSSFDTGLAYEWEGYKMPLRDHALRLLGGDQWRGDQVGTGKILEAVVRAIEIDGRAEVRNNLVSWQNRYGHANRSHHTLLDARADEAQRTRFEALFLGLYTGTLPEAEAFERLRALAGGFAVQVCARSDDNRQAVFEQADASVWPVLPLGLLRGPARDRPFLFE